MTSNTARPMVPRSSAGPSETRPEQGPKILQGPRDEDQVAQAFSQLCAKYSMGTSDKPMTVAIIVKKSCASLISTRRSWERACNREEKQKENPKEKQKGGGLCPSH